MAKHKLFCVPGTWEAVAAANGNPGGITPGAEIGMLRGVTDLLNMGVAEVKRLIGAHQGSFGLLGYSQGGAVVSLVGRELVSGSLTARQRDCKWLPAIAAPHRGRGR
jgi:hypothetical protein